MQFRIADISTCNEEEVQCLLPLVPLFRQEQALKYKHVFGQWACLKTWVMLQELVGRTCDEVYYGPYGKPYLKGGPYFSISHCKTAVAVAIDEEHEIGIDIESIRHANQALIEKTMNEDEQAYIASAANPDRAFTELWTKKEAVLKARGTGLSDGLVNVLDPNSSASSKSLAGSYGLPICFLSASDADRWMIHGYYLDSSISFK